MRAATSNCINWVSVDDAQQLPVRYYTVLIEVEYMALYLSHVLAIGDCIVSLLCFCLIQ